MHVLPPQHGAARATADVADCVGTGDELARDRLVGECIWQVGLGGGGRAGTGAGARVGVEEGLWRRGCNEVGAAVAAGEAFAYYAGRGDEVCEAFVAAEVCGWGAGEVGGWCGGCRGAAGESAGGGGGAPAAEWGAREEVEGEGVCGAVGRHVAR